MVKTIIHKVDDCLFCKKTVTDKFFFATQQFSALYNIAPILPGHSLIIPNIHHESLLELADDELGAMMVFARKVTIVLKTAFNCDGFDWSLQDGISAGQTVSHIHLHIIPRKPNDMPLSTEWYNKLPESENHLLDSENRKRLNEQDYDAITQKLREISASIL
jgi:bis(5'-adenosyl)-triphosphatase